MLSAWQQAHSLGARVNRRLIPVVWKRRGSLTLPRGARFRWREKGLWPGRPESCSDSSSATSGIRSQSSESPSGRQALRIIGSENVRQELVSCLVVLTWGRAGRENLH